jgi:hypothetical protein
MPAFTFEKILPPASQDSAVKGSAVKGSAVKGSAAAPVPPIEKKPRGVIVQMLGRFVEARVERVLRVERSIIERSEQREPE